MMWVVTGHWSPVELGMWAHRVTELVTERGETDCGYTHHIQGPGPATSSEKSLEAAAAQAAKTATQPREAGGTNQRWRRLHRFTVTRIGKADTDIGWPRIGQRWQSSPPIDSLEQAASLLHSQAVDVLGEAERVASLPQFSPGHRAPPKILHSYWAMQTPAQLWLVDSQWQWLRAELPRSR